MSRILSTHQYLKYLNLSDIKLSVENLKTLLTGLKLNQDLTHLNLSSNDLSGILADFNGSRVLNRDNRDIDFASVLQGNTSLQYLNLVDCKLSSNSLKSLFRGLKGNSSLEILDIRGNTIDHSIVEDIVEVLRENASQGLNGIKILNIDQGALSEESVSKLKSLGVSVLVDNNLSSDMEISDLGQEECIISPVKSNMPSLPIDIPPMTLEEATHRNIYNYWLQQHDIPDIARVHYHYGVNELEVVGSNNHLSYVLQSYRNSEHAHPFTIILNIGQDDNRGDHWVSIVLHRVNHQYHAYYTDSFGQPLSDFTASILNSHGILIHDVSIMQQRDGHNCGLWALENANAIRRTLENNNPEGINLPTINAEDFEVLRRTIANELSNDNVRVNNIADYNLV